MSWPTIRLADHCEVITKGTTPTTLGHDFIDTGVPFLRVQNIEGGSVTLRDTLFIDENTHRILERSQIRSGDVLVSIAGTIGRAGVVPDEAPPLNCNQAVAIIRAGADVHRPFLRHWFESSGAQAQMRGATVTGTISNLSLTQLGNLKVPLPPIPEQRRIAEILDKVNALRARRRAALAQLDILTQSIFIDMFGDPVTNPGRWERQKLVNLCESTDDIKCGPFGTQLAKNEYREYGVPLWGIRNVNAAFELPTREFLEPATARRLKQYSIEPGDIVMTRKGTVGNCAVYPIEFEPGIMHSDLLRLRVDKSKFEPNFVAHQLHHSRDVDHQLALISGGAIMPGINVTKLKELKLLVPPLELQRRFSSFVASVRVLRQTQRTSAENLDALFATLQQRAFRAELFL